MIGNSFPYGFYGELTGPSTWPTPPSVMTVSSLLEIETCPLRWALTSSEYTGIWDRKGYPTKPSIGALTGNVVHLVLEKIINALTAAGCQSVEDGSAIVVMRGLGGFTTLTNNCIQEVLDRLKGNPRAERIFEHTERDLRSKVPEMRGRILALLGRCDISGHLGYKSKNSGVGTLGPLHNGTYTEIELKACCMGWKGRVDLFRIADNVCEIIDFKSGEKHDNHVFQIKVYALLWALDTKLNPSGRLATSLKLAYGDKNVVVDPLIIENIQEFRLEVKARQDAAISAISSYPPKCIPSELHCKTCSVRHLCDEYWVNLGSWIDPNNNTSTGYFGDVELIITKEHGPLSLDCSLVASNFGSEGSSVLLRLNQTNGNVNDLKIGFCIRILGCYIVLRESDEDVHILTTGIGSEFFIVSK